MLSPDLISDFLLALVLFLTTFAGQRASSARARKKENRRLTAVNDEQYTYIFKLRRQLINHDIEPLPIPKALVEEGDETE